MVISINGIKKDIPSCFEELTTRQYQLLIPELAKPLADRNYFQIFQIIADTDFKGYEPTSDNEVTIWNAINWIDYVAIKDELPKVLDFNGNIVTLPKKVKASSIGQNIQLKQLLEKSKYLEENISWATAIYLQPLIDGSKFNSDRVAEIKQEIDKMPAYLIRPIGFFLLMSALPHGNGRMSFLKKMTNSLTKKLGRISLNLRRSQGSISLQTLR